MVELTALIWVGWWLSGRLGSTLADPRELVAVGFVVLAVPSFVQGSLKPFGCPGEEREPTWWHRGGGAAVVLVAASVLYILTVA